MTHVGPRMKEDSLLFLYVLVQNCNSALEKNSHKILSNFLGMDESSPVAQLITTLHSKSTNVKWRIEVLECLANLFTSIFCSLEEFTSIFFVNYRKLCTGTRSIMPLFVNLDEDMIMINNCEKETLPIEIVVEYIDTLDQDDYSIKRMKRWFHDAYMKNFLSRARALQINIHTHSHIINESRKRFFSNEIYVRIIGDIILNSNLIAKKIFRSFVMILPSLLLKPSIDDIVIRIIS
ncbi:hypothetical protein ALC57_13330 [Trachymyrmex cornetzi]|uniref:Pre-rRNA-processing protein Ipi1 N-terminal domain-containing protein n=1 Tax=Trachymyrmex cornetzi TaxID=471704 RepID=A0A151IZE6_9HYME|nr:hypothetical protein ALC57_13330 [Trachymyrmex cornetzi]